MPWRAAVWEEMREAAAAGEKPPGGYRGWFGPAEAHPKAGIEAAHRSSCWSPFSKHTDCGRDRTGRRFEMSALNPNGLLGHGVELQTSVGAAVLVNDWSARDLLSSE